MKKNVILIVIDSLRARTLGCYGYPKAISPNIDSLAENGVLFSDCYSCTNATDPSLTTIFSGLYPTSHGIINHGFKVTREELKQFNESKTVLLPEILKKFDYVTLAIDWLGRWHRRGYDLYSGLTKRNRLIDLILRFVKLIARLKSGQFDSASVKRLFDETPWGKRRIEEAGYIGDKAINLIKQNCQSNFFLFIHFWDTHAYHFKGRTLDEKNQKYDEAIAIVDHEIGRIVNALKESNIFDQTLIILTADHGQSLTEHGIYHKHLGLYDETIHVPLIFSFSGLPRTKTVHGFVQHLDLMPTILEILKIEGPGYYDGKSLCPLMENQAEEIRSEVYAEDARFHEERKGERTVRTRRYKYIFKELEMAASDGHYSKTHSRTEELYDLKADPRETVNICKDNPDIACQLRDRYYEWIDRIGRNKNRMEKRRIRERIKGINL